MIGFVPRLYSNELVYSLVARYHQYSSNQSPKHTSMELYGNPMQLAVPDLPLNLCKITSHLKIFMDIDEEELLDRHTFYNFYSNFIPFERKAFVRDAMITGDNKGAVHMITGVMSSVIKEKEHFHHCLQCIEENLELYGETYWHLDHQLPGVLVCVKHNIVLHETSVKFRSNQRNTFLAASKDHYVKPCLNNISTKTLEQLSHVAKDCVRLAVKSCNFEIEMLLEKYKNLLKEKGLVSPNGIVKQRELSERFSLFYGEEILNILQSNVNYENPNCWLKAITRKHRKTFHPVRHILFINFLGESFESIEQTKNINAQPFGSGPYLCLNKAADHYGKPIISEVEITSCSRTKQLIGTFKCKCGFYYTRKQDTSNEYKISRVKQFGTTWLNTVQDLIHNKKMSFRAVASKLGVDTNTIIKYSKANTVMVTKESSISVTNGVCNNKKKEWITIIERNKEKGITQIRRVN